MKSVMQVIRDRRSQKTFTNKPVSNDDIKTLLEAAVLAPNHKLTQPWGFAVLGRLAKQKYGEIKAAMRPPEKREQIIESIANTPAAIVVTQKVDPDITRRKEDYAAIFMAIQNMLLVATSMGLGSKVHTGDILDAAEMHQLINAGEDERIVAIVHLGEPAEAMKPKVRTPAAEKTRWIP